MQRILIIMLLIVVVRAQEWKYQQPDNPRDYIRKHRQQIFESAKTTHITHIEAQQRSRFDARYYRMEMSVDYGEKTISGKLTARLTSRSANLDSVWLDLGDNMLVDSVSGQAKGYRHRDNELALALDQTYQNGQDFTIQIAYSGKPYHKDWIGLVFDQMPDGSPHVWTFSEPYGSRFWWPCKDAPSDKADSMDIIVTVPDDQLVGSNGTLVSMHNNGDGTATFHWHEGYPIATYLVSLAIGKYAHFQDFYHYSVSDSLLLDYYVYPPYEATARQVFAEMPDYLAAFTHFFGPYPFLKEKYGQAQYNYRGAMEHQTLTSIRYVGESWRWVYVHELGHQWFGNQVTCAAWSDIWLNEGFASYSEALYAEWAGYDETPPGKEALHAYMQSQLYLDGGTIHVTDTTQFSTIFGRVVYDKGAWLLHMLRHIMGDETFFSALKSYLADVRWTYGVVSTADFQSVCEAQSGLNLGAFFQQWLYYPYFPKYEFQWDNMRQQGYQFLVQVIIRQTQSTVVYEMPIDLTFVFSNGQDTTVMVQNSSSNQTYDIFLNNAPEKLFLDRENWILKEAVEKQPSYSDKITIYKMYPNPFRENIFIHLFNWSNDSPDLQVYDLLGQSIMRLKPESINHFNFYYRWNGCNEQGLRVAAGIYLLHPLSRNGQPLTNVSARKIILLK